MQVVPAQLRRNIAMYEAARSLLGYITPDFDEVAKVRRARRRAATLVLPATWGALANGWKCRPRQHAPLRQRVPG
jgi:ATP-dependent Zn protease